MFKTVLCILAVFLTTAVLCASVTDDDDNSNRKPGHCRYHGVDIKEGERIPAELEHCQEYKCLDAAENSIGGLGCGRFRLSPDSKCNYIDTDLTKPFPLCCPRADCPDS